MQCGTAGIGLIYTSKPTRFSLGRHSNVLHSTLDNIRLGLQTANNLVKISQVDLGGTLGTCGCVTIGSPTWIETIVPTHTLQLQHDSALKPTSTTWSTASDKRLKGNVQPANLDLCAEIVQSIPLQHFEWLNPVNEVSSDRHVLGWIAQDVRAAFPKAVSLANLYGLPDCHVLDADQIHKVTYGAVQKSLNDMDVLRATVEAQQVTIQAQQVAIHALQAALEALEARVVTLET